MVQVLDMIIHNGKVKLQPSSLAIELDQHVPSFLTSNSSSSLLASMGLRVDPESAPSLLLFPLARKLKPASIELPISDPELLASLAPTADLQILCGETTIRIFNMRRHGYAYISMPQPSGDIILKLGSPREYIKGSAYRKPQSLDPIIYLYSDLSVYKLNILKESISRIIDLKDEKASQFYKIKSVNYITNTNQIEVMVRAKAFTDKRQPASQQDDFEEIEEISQV